MKRRAAAIGEGSFACCSVPHPYYTPVHATAEGETAISNSGILEHFYILVVSSRYCVRSADLSRITAHDDFIRNMLNIKLSVASALARVQVVKELQANWHPSDEEIKSNVRRIRL